MPNFYASCNIQKVISKSYCKKICFAAVLLLLVTTCTLAQVVWTDAGTATNWDGSTNWTPNTAYPSWLTTDIARFNSTGTSNTTGIDMSLGALSIGAIQTSRSRNLTIGNSSATAGTLTLNGATIGGTSNVIITSASSNGSTLYIQDNETGTGKTMNLLLGNSYNVIKPGPSAPIEIGCSISGTGELVVSGNSSAYSVTLSGANSYTGLTTVAVRMGQVILNHPGGGTLPATNDVFISDGTLRINTDQTLHDMNISAIPGCQVRVATGATLTITGTLTDGAAVGVVLEGTGKIVYAPGATLKYSGGNAQNTSSAEFPATSGPTNLTILGTAAYINLHQTRTITGTLTLVGASDIIKLGANNLTVGSIAATPGSTVVTDGTGFLIVPNIGTTPVVFPVGAAAGSHNSVTIANGGGLPYGARVQIGILPALNLPALNETVNRMWIINRPSVSASPVDISFGYSNTDGNPGFDYTAPVALSMINASFGWSTAQSNVPQVQPVTFSLTNAIPAPVNIAFAIANSSSPLGNQKLWTDAGTAADWYGATNWTPNASAASWSAADYAQFNNTGTAVTAGIDMSQGSLSMGAIVIGSRTRDLTIGNSSTTNGTLTLGGISIDAHNDVIIYQSAVNSGTKVTIQDNETGTGKHMDITLTNPGYSRIWARSTIEIKSAITGADKKIVFDGGSAGYVILTGANSYSGHTIITGSAIKVALARPGGSTLTNDTNDITVGGRLEILTDQSLRNVIVKKDGFLTVGDGATLTVTGSLIDINTDLNHIICIGTGKIVYAPAAYLVYNNGIPLTTSSAELPLANGPARIEVGAGTSLTLHASRTINGPLTLAGGTLSIGSNSLTCNTVTATGGSVITNGTGRLIVKNVGVAPVSFPVTTGGITNTVTIANGQGLDYGVGVVAGISPAIVTINNAVNRTWYIKPSATPAQPVNVSFAYSNGDGNAGFNYSSMVEIAQYNGAWNVLQSGVAQVQPLAVTLATLTGNTDNAFIISNVGAVLASSSVDFNVVKQNDNGHLTWTIENTGTLKQLEIERSANGRSFTSLATVATTSIYFDDNQLLAATNYYRLKMTDVNGKISYSITIALINGKRGFDMISILPTVVNSNATLNVTTAQKTRLDLVITDASGRKIQQMKYTVNAGSSQLPLNLVRLSTGVYVVTAHTPEGDIKTLRFVKN